MEHPLVSVIVVSYNHSKYIDENLDSVKSQNYPNIELILADDASEDNSVEIFNRWTAKNGYAVKTNFHKVNTGLAIILNECIKLASGQYIKLISADDYFHSNYLSECITAMQKEKSQVVFTQAFSVKSNSVVLKKNYFPIPDHPTVEMERKLSSGNFVSGATLCFEKEVLKLIGNYNPSTLLEDYDFILRVISKSLKISYVDDNLIYYRNHTHNISKVRLLDLEIETEKLKYKYLQKKDFAPVINASTKTKVNRYGKRFSMQIFSEYIKYPHRSSKVILKMILSVIK